MQVVHEECNVDVKSVPAGGLFMCHGGQYYIKYIQSKSANSIGLNVNTGELAVIAMSYENFSVRYFPKAKIVTE